MVAKRRDPVPHGQYEAKIVRSERVRTFEGECLELDFEIIGGAHDGRIIERHLFIYGGDRRTQRDRAELSHICRAVGVMTPKDSSDLHNIPMVIQVGRDKRKNTIVHYWAKPTPQPPGPTASAPTSEATTAGPSLVRLCDVEPEPVQWLWPMRVALGKLTILAGDPGLGKSFLTMDMAARVSTGAGWPDLPGQRFEPGGVIILSAEDDPADTIVPRLVAAQADRSRITALKAVCEFDPHTGKLAPRGLNLETDIRHLDSAIEQTPDCRLVILDPITAYTGKTDSHKNAETRGLLAPLADLAAKHEVAMVAVSHLNKGGSGPAIYRTMGSLAFVAAARAAWAVVKDDNDPGRRLVVSVKNNLARDPGGLAYHLDGDGDDVPALAWEAEPVTITADEALAPPAPGPEPDERSEAMQWLREALADGPRLAKEVEEEAREAHGITQRTLRRARKHLGVVAYREEVPGPWWWRSAEHEPVEAG